jgi:hypothetical protein
VQLRHLTQRRQDNCVIPAVSLPLFGKLLLQGCNGLGQLSLDTQGLGRQVEAAPLREKVLKLLLGYTPRRSGRSGTDRLGDRFTSDQQHRQRDNKTESARIHGRFVHRWSQLDNCGALTEFRAPVAEPQS